MPEFLRCDVFWHTITTNMAENMDSVSRLNTKSYLGVLSKVVRLGDKNDKGGW